MNAKHRVDVPADALSPRGATPTPAPAPEPSPEQASDRAPERAPVPRGRRVAGAVAMGVVSGAVSAIPIWRIPRGRFSLVPGALAAGVTTAAVVLATDQHRRTAEVQREPLPEVPVARRIAMPAVLGAAAGGATAGSFWLMSVTDEWTERGLAKLGARRPRATYAVLAGFVGGIMEYADPALARLGLR